VSRSPGPSSKSAAKPSGATYPCSREGLDQSKWRDVGLKYIAGTPTLEVSAVKKLINRPETVVEEMIEGLVAVYPGLRRLPGHTSWFGRFCLIDPRNGRWR